MKLSRFVSLNRCVSIPTLGRLSSVVCLLALAGCSLPEAKPDPTRLFLLAGATSTGAGPVVAPPAAKPALGMRPVTLAAYLRAPSLVAISGGAEVRPVGDARWAEPLGDGVARVVRETLLAQGAVRSVVVFPAPHDAVPELELSLRVDACEGVVHADGSAVARFVAEWSVQSTTADAKVLFASRYAPAPSSWDGRDPAALAQALGAATAGLADEIAAALTK